MIIVKIVGGLANQMFTYSLGRRMSLMHGVPLKLDISDYMATGRDYLGRKYSLGVFTLEAAFASVEEIRAFSERKEGDFRKAVRSLLGKKPKRPSSYIKEKIFGFDPLILNQPDNIYLRGNWCSPKYFEDVEGQIRRDFTFRAKQVGENFNLVQEIRSVESVSLHVRRGDFVTNAKINQIYGTCSLEYYQRCIDDLSSKVNSPIFYVFSDDSQWTRDNLKSDFPMVFVDHNDPDVGYEDMRLMSQCKHNIVANSGFSWWGAWLNPNPDKMVYAPQNWFASGEYDISSLIPEGWRLL